MKQERERERERERKRKRETKFVMRKVTLDSRNVANVKVY